MLEELFVDKCELSVSLSVPVQELPESIGELKQLRVLNVGNNLLTALPASLGSLGTLEELVMNSNQLECLPSFIGRLSHLRVLIANSNRIAEVAEELAGAHCHLFSSCRFEGIEPSASVQQLHSK